MRYVKVKMQTPDHDEGSSAPTAVPERNFSLKHAEKTVLETIDGLGLAALLTELSAKAESTAVKCTLIRPDGSLPPEAEGLGKGTQQEARVGALFEALEHMHFGPEGPDLEQAKVLRVSDFLNTDADSVPAPVLDILTEQQEANMAVVTYDLLEQEHQIQVPLGLVAPWYVEDTEKRIRANLGDDFYYGSLMRYTTSSGAAIGIGTSEALLHGLNESIERDDFSLFLAQTFFNAPGTRHSFRVVDPATFPPKIARAMMEVSALRRAPVHLLDISGSFGPRTLVAYVEPSGDFKNHRRGVGSSMSFSHAAWRAISELVQTLLHTPQDEEAELLSGLAHVPEIHRCATFDLTPYMASAPATHFEQDDPTRLSVDAQVKELSGALFAGNIRVGTRAIRTFDSGISVLHTYSPDLETFMLVCGGCLVPPGPRAVSAISSAPSAR